jgi:hypothetical protein
LIAGLRSRLCWFAGAAGIVTSIAALKLLVHLYADRHYGYYHAYSMPYEHFDVFYCRGLKRPIQEIWPRVKNWD